MRETVTYEKKSHTFVFRVAAVIVDHERVLLHRAKGDHFWSLPGGKAIMMEPSKEVLKREILEELAQEIVVSRLLWVVENFFTDHKQGQQYHELGFYFLASLPPASELVNNEHTFLGRKSHHGQNLVFSWFSQDASELKNIPIYPLFLKYALANLPVETEHVVNHDRSI
jgi:ADP-ribose pyrophosphatase YjhB (NUDIX family)